MAEGFGQDDFCSITILRNIQGNNHDLPAINIGHRVRWLLIDGRFEIILDVRRGARVAEGAALEKRKYHALKANSS